MPDFPTKISGWLLDLIAFVGLGLGGSQAAAAGELDRIRQISLRDHGDVQLSPERLAEAVLKSTVGEEWAAGAAELGGVSHENFRVLLGSIGNPPGAGELLDLWRRGAIDEATFELGLRQGYTRNDWIGRIATLRRVLLPIGELVAGVVQNHKEFGAAMSEATLHGVDGDDFQLMVDNAGNPPGPMEVLNLWNRGYITEADVDQALRESRLKNKWIPALKNLAVHKIPLRTVTTLLTHNAITDEQAAAHLRELGYSADDAAALVKAAHFQKAAPEKRLSVAAIRELYAEHAIDRPTAIADLVTIGYPAAVADQIMQLADIDVKNSARKASITRVRSAFYGRRIDRHGASNELDRLQVPPDQRDALLALWDVELDTNVRLLTEAQVVAAGRAKLFTADETVNRLVAMGYTSDDAFVLAVLGKVVPNPTTPTTLGG